MVQQGPREHYDSHGWNSHWYEGRFRRLFDRWAKVVQCSDRVRVEWFKQVSPISEVRADEIAVSGIGTIAAARVIPLDSDTQPFIVVSMYARWMRPHPSTGSSWRVGAPDASAHRIISDLSAFVGDTDPASHRIIAAGDLNMAYKLPPARPESFAERERTVFTRMEVLGMEFLGPRHPHGRRADPQPDPPPILATCPPITRASANRRPPSINSTTSSRREDFMSRSGCAPRTASTSRVPATSAGS